MAGNEVILLNRGYMGEPYVIENVCFVGSDESVDITIEQGRIADVRSSEKSVAKGLQKRGSFPACGIVTRTSHSGRTRWGGLI